MELRKGIEDWLTSRGFLIAEMSVSGDQGGWCKNDETSSPKNENSVIIYLHKLFQTCMSFFLLLSTKEDILKNVGNQTVDGIHWLL